MKDNFISVDQSIYATSIVVKYLYTAKVKTSTKFHNITLTSDMILTKAVTSTKFNKEFNIHYIACIGSFIYLLSRRVDCKI